MTYVPYAPHKGIACWAERYGMTCNHMGHQAAGILHRASISPEMVPMMTDRELLDLRNFGPTSLALVRAAHRRVPTC